MSGLSGGGDVQKSSSAYEISRILRTCLQGLEEVTKEEEEREFAKALRAVDE